MSAAERRGDHRSAAPRRARGDVKHLQLEGTRALHPRSASPPRSARPRPVPSTMPRSASAGSCSRASRRRQRASSWRTARFWYSGSPSDLVIAHDVMEDAIDADTVRRALAGAGVNGDRSRVVGIFAKAEAEPSGRIRGRRHTLMDDSDINHTRHAPAAVAGGRASGAEWRRPGRGDRSRLVTNDSLSRRNFARTSPPCGRPKNRRFARQIYAIHMYSAISR